MIQFILNNKPFSLTDREDLIPYYLGLGCIQVPKLYNGSFLNPIWNGTDFIEEATPEEIAEQKHYKIEEIKKFQYQELLPTDWYYTRFLETGQEVPLEIKQQRQQIREKYENLIKSY